MVLLSKNLTVIITSTSKHVYIKLMPLYGIKVRYNHPLIVNSWKPFMCVYEIFSFVRNLCLPQVWAS